jgi:DNA-binding CsgD family transcriptional regulator
VGRKHIMNPFFSSLMQAKDADEITQLTARFLSRISDKLNKHLIWMVDRSGKRTVVHGDDNNQGFKSCPPNLPVTNHLWMLVEPPEGSTEAPKYPSMAHSRKNEHGNSHPAVATCIIYAHTCIISLKQRERALKAGISPRERETLLLLARGFRSDKIAHRMGIKRVTVNLHISNARRKLASTTREQAVARAVHMGIISP